MKQYIVKLSDRTEILIDEDEVSIVKKGISSGNIVQLKNGLFNPTYFIALIENKQIDQEIWKAAK